MKLLILFLLLFSFTLHASQASCDLRPGLADSYQLALSWQPAFCQTYGYEAGKPECLKLSEKAYSSHHLVLHGLWPNQDACGYTYGFCGVSSQKSHCAYSPLVLTFETASLLKQIMPSYAFGSCLERHEWNKHGSCQFLPTDAYFELAMRLTQEADNTSFGEFINKHRGLYIKKGELQQKIQESFGRVAAKKIYLGCKNGLLVDIMISLPANLTMQESLNELIQNARDSKGIKEGCPERFKISDFNSNNESTHQASG